ncbi:biopolymer transport protein TolQ [Amorphus suaedae]
MDSTVAVAGADLAAHSGFSLFGLFLQAHIVVKIVMLGLVSASIWCWAIIVDKVVLYRRTRQAMNRFEDAFWSGQSLEDLYRTLSSRSNQALAAVFVAAMTEWKRSHDGQHPAIASLSHRLDRVMTLTIGREAERLESRLAVLASVGSAGPFIGLFGTVWGIMTSFQAIAVSESTNLAVVAPGIAEALFATALGLLAAIPAVIFFNKLSGDVSKIISRMDGFADEFLAILSREIDERLEEERV